jgi:hypothetical protein
MTTLTRSAPLAGRRRPVPWTRLAWVSWRQRRVSLITAAILLAAISLYLLITGLPIHSAYAGLTSCHPVSSARCQNLAFAFNQDYWAKAGAPIADHLGDPRVISALLLIVPALLGVFAGAPLLARELETGTFRFAWTQGCGRLRWSLAQLALPAITLIAATGAFSALYSWYIRPFVAEEKLVLLMPLLFPAGGIAFAAWTLAAFAIGAFAGVSIRRTVPAIAAALGAWAGLAVVTTAFLRPHYETPLRISGGVPHAGPFWLYNNWVLSSWTTGPGGRPVSAATFNSLVPVSIQNSQLNGFAHWMTQHGYTQWWSYQPASRYVHLQLIEGGWLLALSVVLIAATVWMIRRRAW